MKNLTKTKISLAILVLLCLFSTPCWAADTSTMTPEQLQAYVTQLEGEVIQPQMIVMQADQQLTIQLDLLQSELADMKKEMTSMQERFNRLATDTKTTIESGNKSVVTDIKTQTQVQLNETLNIVKDYIDQKTNPIRQTAPAVGAFLILSGCFLLWASRQYKLTNQGARNK